MKLYTSTQLESPSTKPILVPSNTQSIIIDNYSPYSFELNSTQGTIDLLPFSTRTIPVVSGSTWECSPIGSVPTESLGNISFSVSIFYSPYSFSNYGQSANLPLFDAPITISNATVNVGGTINANITNATVKVSGNINANITNATIKIEPTATASFPITGSVSINSGQTVLVENATGATLNVVGSMNITNATVNVAGGVNANITNATIKIEPTATASFPITGSVSINSGQTVLVKNATGASLTVAGTVDANIQNATIDTNSTVVNEQLNVALPLSGYITIDVPASGVAPEPNVVNANILPNGGGLINMGILSVTLQSANGYFYNLTVQPQLDVDNTLLKPVGSFTWDFTNSSQAGYSTANLMSSYNWGQVVTCNSINASVLQTTSATEQYADTVTIYWSIDGSATPDLTHYGYPATVQLEYATTSTPALVSVTSPVPAQIYTGPNTPIGPSNPLPVAIDNYAMSLYTVINASELPTTATYQITNTGLQAIQWFFISVTNTSTSNGYVNILLQNNADTSQTTSLTVKLENGQTLEQELRLPYPWAPFGVGTGANLNIGVSTGVSGVYGTVLCMGANVA